MEKETNRLAGYLNISMDESIDLCLQVFCCHLKQYLSHLLLLECWYSYWVGIGYPLLLTCLVSLPNLA
jgi:hypothetical protein